MSIKLLLKSLLRRKLVTVLLLIQLTVTLALLVNSSLLALQARELLNRPTGLDLTNTLLVQLRPTTAVLAEPLALSDLQSRQLAGLVQINGVVAAAYSLQAPLKFGGQNGSMYDLDVPEKDRISLSPIPTYSVSVDFFKTLDLKVISGQLPTALDPLIDFANVDLAQLDIRKRSLVITQSLAKRLYGDQPAVGRYTNNGHIMAVVADFAGQRISEDINFNALSIEHTYSDAGKYILMVRTQPGMADKVETVLADRIRAVDSNVDIIFVHSLEEQKNQLYGSERGLAILLATLSVLMLLVAMVSAYSGAFFHALKQQQEIGIKRAIGASKGFILRELFAEAWLTTGMGCLLGIVACLSLNRLLAIVLTIPTVPVWLPLVTIGLLFFCVTLATWKPARVAVNVSPVTATKSL